LLAFVVFACAKLFGMTGFTVAAMAAIERKFHDSIVRHCPTKWNMAAYVIENILAVRVGFEPTDESPHQRFSRPPDSTTLAPHRINLILPDSSEGFFRTAAEQPSAFLRAFGSVAALPDSREYSCKRSTHPGLRFAPNRRTIQISGGDYAVTRKTAGLPGWKRYGIHPYGSFNRLHGARSRVSRTPSS